MLIGRVSNTQLILIGPSVSSRRLNDSLPWAIVPGRPILFWKKESERLCRALPQTPAILAFWEALVAGFPEVRRSRYAWDFRGRATLHKKAEKQKISYQTEECVQLNKTRCSGTPHTAPPFFISYCFPLFTPAGGQHRDLWLLRHLHIGFKWLSCQCSSSSWGFNCPHHQVKLNFSLYFFIPPIYVDLISTNMTQRRKNTELCNPVRVISALRPRGLLCSVSISE